MVIDTGKAWTFKLITSRVIEYRTETWIKDQLVFLMQNYGEVVSVERPLFTRMYVVIMRPSTSTTLAWWEKGFSYAFDKMGYGYVRISEALPGKQTTSLVQETISPIVEPVKAAAAGIANRLLVLAAVAAVAFIFVKGGFKR